MQTTYSRSLTENSVAPDFSTLDMQRMGTNYWKRLVTRGVPSADARELATAIIHFIYLNSQSSYHQRHLLGRYYQHICAANLSSLGVL